MIHTRPLVLIEGIREIQRVQEIAPVTSDRGTLQKIDPYICMTQIYVSRYTYQNSASPPSPMLLKRSKSGALSSMITFVKHLTVRMKNRT